MLLNQKMLVQSVKKYQLSLGSHTHVTVTLTPPAGKYRAGTKIKVTATADSGYELGTLQWNGTSISSGGVFTMPAKNVVVTATTTSSVAMYALSLGTHTGVNLTLDPPAGTYAVGTKIKVTASAKAKYMTDSVVVKWNGTTITTGQTFSMPSKAVVVTATAEMGAHVTGTYKFSTPRVYDNKAFTGEIVPFDINYYDIGVYFDTTTASGTLDFYTRTKDSAPHATVSCHGWNFASGYSGTVPGFKASFTRNGDSASYSTVTATASQIQSATKNSVATFTATKFDTSPYKDGDVITLTVQLT